MTTSTTPKRAHARYDHRQFVGRVVIATALAAGAALLPQAGEHRHWVALFLALVVIPAHVVVRVASRVPNPTALLELLAVTSGAVCALIEPSLWSTAILFQALTIAASVAYQRPRWVATNSFVALTAMVGVALTCDVRAAVGPIVTLGVFVPVLIDGARRVQAGERRATSRMRATVESLPVMVWDADPETGRLRSVIGRVESVLGLERDQLLEEGFVDRMHPDDRGLHWTEREAGHRAGVSTSYRYVRPDGEIVWLRDHVTVAVDGNGPVAHGVTLDVTEAYANEVALRGRHDIVERMAASTVVLEQDPLGELRIRYVVDPIGLGIAGSVGATFTETLPDLAGLPALHRAIAHPRGVTTVGPERLVDPDERFVEIEVFPISGDGIALLISDVTQREQAIRTIKRQAYFDDLTGLPNRSMFMEMVQRLTSTKVPTGVLLIDLNRFKEVNDTLGHLSGDAFLRALAARLDGLARAAGCTVARLGGDEFAFVVCFERREEVAALAGAVANVCLQPVEVHGSAVASSASIGIALSPQDAATPEELLRCADVAMYRAKGSRLGTYWYEPSFDRRADDIEALGQLRAALDAGQFVMYFQPVVQLGAGQLVGAEALARWHHPTRGVLAPNAFLDLLSVAGLSGRLTSVVIEQAIAAAARIGEPFTISLNLTAHDLRNPDLATEFAGALTRHGVAAHQVFLEITEEHLLDVSGVVAATLNDLADIGLTIAVDDFGTGYSSLTHLRSLPVSHLKIDRQFVQGVLDDGQDEVIVRAMTDLAHNLGLRVTAEGVETEDVADRVRSLGCDLGQGYLWGRPVPIDEFVTFAGAPAGH